MQKAAGRKGSVASTVTASSSSAASSPTSSIDALSPMAREFIRSPTGDGSFAGISKLLSIPTEQLASCHFFSNFILVPRQGCTRGFMDYLLPLMKDEKANGHLQYAFNACSLAHLGNRVKSNGENIPNQALSEYTKALASTHKALKDPELSKTDGTLAAVLLLGLYEVSRLPAEKQDMVILIVREEHNGQRNGCLLVGLAH